MPVDFPVYEGTGDSRAILARYVLTIRDFLAELIENPRDRHGTFLIREELLGDLRSAFAEARPEFDRVARATAALTDSAIQDHGLAGAQLRFKLRVVRFRYGRYLERGGFGPIRWLIDTIDTLLESILDAVGVGGGIAEIKDYVKHALDD